MLFPFLKVRWWPWFSFLLLTPLFPIYSSSHPFHAAKPGGLGDGKKEGVIKQGADPMGADLIVMERIWCRWSKEGEASVGLATSEAVCLVGRVQPLKAGLGAGLVAVSHAAPGDSSLGRGEPSLVWCQEPFFLPSHQSSTLVSISTFRSLWWWSPPLFSVKVGVFWL